MRQRRARQHHVWRHGRQKATLPWKWVAVAALALGQALAVRGGCGDRKEVNEQLAATAHDALAMAEQAARSNDTAYLLPGQNRLLAVVLGASVPTAGAVLIVVLCLRRSRFGQ